jgi:CelD/BcsL family acetyltransferase involved in cellulose biosynthesis
MRVELVEDPAVFRTRDWTPLVMADAGGTLFHTPAYLKLWWEEFGSGSLAVALLEDEGRPAGACAFQLEDGILTFLGGFDVTDYMGPVALPGCEAAVSKELLMAVAADLEWERADLRGLPSASPWLGALESAALALGFWASTQEDGVAPVLRLPASFDAYLAGLPSKLRHEIRRKSRRLEARFGGYQVTLASPETLPAHLDRFVALHKTSPGPKGKFMHAGMEIFFRRLAEAFHPPHVFHLAFIEVGGTPAAGAIGLTFKDTFSLYNSAFDRGFAEWSPGMVLVADMIAGAIGEGRSTSDLLKGDLGYKYRFGPTPRPLQRISVER